MSAYLQNEIEALMAADAECGSMVSPLGGRWVAQCMDKRLNAGGYTQAIKKRNVLDTVRSMCEHDVSCRGEAQGE
ncbi:MAG: hypothetical protein Q9194_003138 [Teloschistes cf. exilis]